MSFQSTLIAKLESFTSSSLSNLLFKLGLPKSLKKQENIVSLSNFLLDPQNTQKISENLSANMKKNLNYYSPDSSLLCICATQSDSELITCTRCLKKQHVNCVTKIISMKNYECIKCQIYQMNPADEIVEYLTEPSLISSDPLRPKTEKFNLSRAALEEITSGKKFYEIQIRCLKVDVPGYTIKWPKQGLLYINGKPLTEFKEGSRNKNRKDRALDVSFQVKSGENSVQLVKRNDPELYCLVVLKIKRIKEDELFQKIILKKIDMENSLKNISFNEESEVSTKCIRINFKCPYTLMMIDTPARGKFCKHVNCFDLLMFIKRQQYEDYRWRCPICRGLAFSVIVDSYFQKIIENIKETNHIEWVEISEDGQYVPVFDSKIENSELKCKNFETQASTKRLKFESDAIILEEKNKSAVIEID